MKFIAALDYEHLDNGVFLTAVARALSQLQNQQAGPIMVVHGESEYTERLIQTGIMREEAEVRAIKDLNHRLIALFADQGVSAVGLNGYQREGITLNENDELSLKRSAFEMLHEGPILVLSNLVMHKKSSKPTPVPLSKYLNFLQKEFSPQEVFVFSKYDHKDPQKQNEEIDNAELIPDDLRELSLSPEVTTASTFEESVSKIF